MIKLLVGYLLQEINIPAKSKACCHRLIFTNFLGEVEGYTGYEC